MVWTIACFRTTNQLELVYAVNAGGSAHTDSNGIVYEADTLPVGTSYRWLPTITGVNDNDRELYQTSQISKQPLNYELPLTGDGWYGLVLHHADDSAPSRHFRRVKVILNGQHVLLEDLSVFKECGESNACNNIFYFTVCGNTLNYADQTSVLWNPKKVHR
jgi:Malectin domain